MPRSDKKAIWLIVILLCVLPTFAQNDQKRIALVIGNNNYASPNGLRNPGTDAADMAGTLEQLGFEVIRGINQNKQQTEKLIDDFGKRLAESKEIGLVYYTGIGFQSNGENFIVPVNASFVSEEETVKSSVPLNTLLSTISGAKNKLNLVLLDPTTKTPFQSLWQNQSFDTYKNGFARILPPANTVVFYSAETGRTALEKCGRNGYFTASFLNQLEKPELEFGQLSKNVAEEISKKTGGQQKPFSEGVLINYFYLTDENHRLKPVDKNSLEWIFESFKAEMKCSCGHRDEGLALGKAIIEKYGNDEENKEVIEYTKKQVLKIEKEDPVCLRNERYNNSFKAKNWGDFFAVTKEIINYEGDSPLALDLMLTAVSVGFDRTTVDKIDTYNNDTLSYAKTALQKIDAGRTSKTGKWGVFVPFDTKEKAQSWLNFILGWELYYKMNQKKEALSFLYKSTQISDEKKGDISIYTAIGQYYFDEASRLDTEYREKREANNNEENDEIKALLELARGTADRAMDAFERAYKIIISKPNPDKNHSEPIKQTLDDLYRFRFNIPPGDKPEGADIYFENLISKPMPDPATPVEPAKP